MNNYLRNAQLLVLMLLLFNAFTLDDFPKLGITFQAKAGESYIIMKAKN